MLEADRSFIKGARLAKRATAGVFGVDGARGTLIVSVVDYEADKKGLGSGGRDETETYRAAAVVATACFTGLTEGSAAAGCILGDAEGTRSGR